MEGWQDLILEDYERHEFLILPQASISRVSTYLWLQYLRQPFKLSTRHTPCMDIAGWGEWLWEDLLAGCRVFLHVVL